MTKTRPSKPKRDRTGPKRLFGMAETLINQLLKEEKPALAARALEAIARILGAWPDLRLRVPSASPGDPAGTPLMTAADVEAAKAKIMTEDEWAARYSPPQ